MTAPVVLTGLVVADDPSAWEAAGFAVADGRCRVDDVHLELLGRSPSGAARAKGIVAARLGGVDGPADLDGLRAEPGVAPSGPAAVHPNGVTELDHVVLLSPDVDRTVAALGALGLEPKRTRHVDPEQYGFAARQVFFRLGTPILELIGPDEPGPGADAQPVTCFGLAFTVSDIDALPQRYGDHLGRIKDAVQPGRRIATLRHKEFDMSVATAFMTPGPKAA